MAAQGYLLLHVQALPKEMLLCPVQAVKGKAGS